jgi:hypothetical protein
LKKTMPGENLGSLIRVWAEAVWNQRPEQAAPLLAEDVVWEGALPGTICRGRGEVLGLLRGWDRPPRLTRLEAFESGDCVCLFATGPELHPGGRVEAGGESCIVFTFADGLIVAMRSFPSRDEALAHASANLRS